MTTRDQNQILTHESALDLAGDLLRQLAEHVGDERELDAVFCHWLDVLDALRFLQVCTAAMRTTFVECLTIPDPSDDWPEGGIAFTTEETDQ